MSDFVFLNVYSGRSPQDKTDSAEPALWNVYLNEKENIYLIQKLDENNKPTSEKYKISPTFFGVNFRKANKAQLETKNKKNIIFVRSKDKSDDSTNSNSSVQAVRSSIAEKKKTGEFLVQLSKNNPQAIQKKSEEAPKSNLSAKKTTNEFQLGVSAAPQKKTNVNDFGLSSLFNSIAKSNKKGNPSLTLSTQNINKIQETKTTAPEDPKTAAAANSAPASNAVAEQSSAEQFSQTAKTLAAAQQSDAVIVKASDTLKQDKQIVIQNTAPAAASAPAAAQAAQTIPTAQHIGNVINVKTPDTSVQNKPVVQAVQMEEPKQTDSPQNAQNATAEKQPEPAAKESSQTAKDNAQKDAITETEEALLQPKRTDNDFQLSEKALRLDKSLRAEFQVSLTHWNSAKKNLAQRHFYDILNRPGNYVPAHKHMFTDFAIKLRKINLQDLALQFATKSTTLSPDDSHAFFNVARLYYELGRYEEAEGFIDKAIELEKDLTPALRLSGIIKECIRRKAKNR